MMMMMMMKMMNFFSSRVIDEKRLALFSARTIVRGSHYCKSPTRREQDLNLRRTLVQALINEVAQY